MTSQPFLIRRPGWWLIAISAIVTALVFASPYASLSAAMSRIPLNPAYQSHIYWLALHALPSGIALAIGPFQFLATARTRWPAVHRNAGRVYLVCVLMGSIAAVSAAIMTTSGFAAQTGFMLLVAAWLFSGFSAYRSACRRRFAVHRIWMIRNYALTFAAVLLRIFLLAGLALRKVFPGIPFDQIYTTSVWGSILISSLMAEWFVVSPAGRDTAHPAASAQIQSRKSRNAALRSPSSG